MEEASQRRSGVQKAAFTGRFWGGDTACRLIRVSWNFFSSDFDLRSRHPEKQAGKDWPAFAALPLTFPGRCLRNLTFIPRSSPAASEGIRRSGVHVHAQTALCNRVSVRAHVRLLLGYVQCRCGLMQETQFDTSAVKITCVQTVIALQTIRTAVTQFLKVNAKKQGGSARPEITLQKTHKGDPWGGGDRR